MPPTKTPLVEIAIPVLNEENRLERGVRLAMEFFSARGMDKHLITIADNGSTDATQKISQNLVGRYPARIRYVYIGEIGVGRALKTVWRSSKAQIIGSMDVDIATDLRHVSEAVEIIRKGEADVVNGSRLLPGSDVINRALLRELTSRSFNAIIRALLTRGVTDGMCGFTFLPRNVFLTLASILASNGWFFSTELLVKAIWKGYRLKEIPICWIDGGHSKVKIFSLSITYMREILRVRRQRKLF